MRILSNSELLHLLKLVCSDQIMRKLSNSELLYLLKLVCSDFDPSKFTFTADGCIVDGDTADILRLLNCLSLELSSRIELPF